jgi:nitrogen fixation/metabolism regulation signal transduction histidine kinase
MLASLFGGLALLVVLIGFGGIVVTHRVAGPIYKMKMNLKAVADGHLRIPTPLRKGDELVEFFEAYRKMVIALRGRQEDEILRLEKAIVSLETKTGASELDGLNTLKRDMKAALDT